MRGPWLEPPHSQGAFACTLAVPATDLLPKWMDMASGDYICTKTGKSDSVRPRSLFHKKKMATKIQDPGLRALLLCSHRASSKEPHGLLHQHRSVCGDHAYVQIDAPEGIENKRPGSRTSVVRPGKMRYPGSASPPRGPNYQKETLDQPGPPRHCWVA